MAASRLPRTTIKITVLAVSIACLSACGIVRTGIYFPVGTYPDIKNKLPLSIRAVGILRAGSKEEQFNEGELRRVEVELAHSLNDDMLKMGLFRAPISNEKPYILDVEFPELSMRTSLASLLLVIPGSMSLSTLYLLGMPYMIVKHKGEAVFKLYSPDGNLTHETITYKESTHAIGLYYGHYQSFADMISTLADKFKADISDRVDSIRMKIPVASIYGKFRRTDPYNLMANQIIMNSGPTQINNIDQSQDVSIKQNFRRNNERKVATRKK